MSEGHVFGEEEDSSSTQCTKCNRCAQLRPVRRCLSTRNRNNNVFIRDPLDKWIAAHSLASAVQRYMNDRRAFYKGLATFEHFGRGWLRRCDEIETAALRLMP